MRSEETKGWTCEICGKDGAQRADGHLLCKDCFIENLRRKPHGALIAHKDMARHIAHVLRGRNPPYPDREEAEE